MAMKKLGRGLDALLGDFTATPPEGVVQADIYMIDTNADQPRKTFDEERLNELAESLKRHGMVQPIIVHQNGDRYTIVAGERRFRAARLAGNTHFMIIVAEGAGSAIEIGKQIHETIGLDPRVTILGHIQRGGTPTARDRVMATRMGYHAVKSLAEGKTNRLICSQQGSMVDIDLEEGLAMKKGLNAQQYEVLQAMTGLEIEGL